MNSTTDRFERFQRLEELLGRVLILGVVASAVVLGIGLAIEFFGGNAHPVLQLGLVLLMATPILRVAVSLVEYVRMRDWFFAATATAVLLVLLTSVTLALAR
jgi:uncharacterized membrane protein